MKRVALHATSSSRGALGCRSDIYMTLELSWFGKTHALVSMVVQVEDSFSSLDA